MTLSLKQLLEDEPFHHMEPLYDGQPFKHSAQDRSQDALSVERNAYYTARHRCQYRTDRAWGWYGGRGIEFRFKNFDQFIRHIGPKPPSKDRLMLARINPEGHYEVGNVHWSTYKLQAGLRRKPRLPVFSS